MYGRREYASCTLNISILPELNERDEIEATDIMVLFLLMKWPPFRGWHDYAGGCKGVSESAAPQDINVDSTQSNVFVQVLSKVFVHDLYILSSILDEI